MKRPASFSPRVRRGSRPHRSLGVALFLVVGALIAIAAACSNQGEGERCDFLNGDDDCKTGEGLACYPSAQLKDTISDRCCPRDRTKATHPVCQTAVDFVGADSSTPADTGPAVAPEASSPDADVSPDADAGGDAGDADSDADADQ